MNRIGYKLIRLAGNIYKIISCSKEGHDFEREWARGGHVRMIRVRKTKGGNEIILF